MLRAARSCISGLKQSGHKWNKLLTATLKKSGFKPSKVDPCLFVKQDGDGPIKGVATCHVDDLLMTGSRALIDQLRKDLGEKSRSTTSALLKRGVAPTTTRTAGDGRLQPNVADGGQRRSPTDRRDRVTLPTLEALSCERVLDQREGKGQDLHHQALSYD